MVLMQIAEPGASETSPEGPRKVGVGIDLGTTNSLIAHFDGDRLSVLPDEAGAMSLPSVAYYGQAEVIVGDAAVVLAAEHSADTIASAKRFMGKSRERCLMRATLNLLMRAWPSRQPVVR
jgi:molecular chaperone HscA